LLASDANCALGADICIEKRIPAGAGFGGGSSDAATVLVALDALWNTGLGVERLAGLGLRLGADVPVFVRGDNAWAEGVGERLTPVALPPAWYLLVDPGVHVATGELFQAPELRGIRPRDNSRLRFAAVTASMLATLRALLRRRRTGVEPRCRWAVGSRAYGTGSGSSSSSAIVRPGGRVVLLQGSCGALAGLDRRGAERSPLHLALEVGGLQACGGRQWPSTGFDPDRIRFCRPCQDAGW